MYFNLLGVLSLLSIKLSKYAIHFLLSMLKTCIIPLVSLDIAGRRAFRASSVILGAISKSN